MAGSLQLLEIRLPGMSPFLDYDFHEKLVAGPFSIVNLFIGQNNSGKSRLLRALFAGEPCDFTTKEFNAKQIIDYAKEFGRSYDALFTGPLVGISGFKKDALKQLINRESDGRFISLSHPIGTELRTLLSSMAGARREEVETIGTPPVTHEMIVSFRDRLKRFADLSLPSMPETPDFSHIWGQKRFYIPMLRGMRPLNQTENLYRDRTSADYFAQGQDTTPLSSGNLIIFTGLELYNTLESSLLGEPEQKDAVEQYQAFLSSHFFDGLALRLIPKKGANTVHVKIGDEKQFPIYNLGDGLQQLIIITFNMFMEKERCLFFIEEPDLSMHPGMQRTLIETMMANPQHQYFVTTHSNHLLDVTLDSENMSVFLFRKSVEHGSVRFRVSTGASKEALKDIGARSSSVMLANSTIWVEGITDRLYLRQYLKKYVQGDGKKYASLREDIHYAFVEYQGSNLGHWTFEDENKEEELRRMKAVFLCSNPFLLADGDIPEARKAVYSSELKEKFVTLPCKEIENLIPEAVLKAVLKKDGKVETGKTERVNFSNYSALSHGLGKYLDELFGGNLYAEPSGTIRNKIAFCDEAVRFMETNRDWDFPDKMKEICGRILGHVEKSNA